MAKAQSYQSVANAPRNGMPIWIKFRDLTAEERDGGTNPQLLPFAGQEYLCHWHTFDDPDFTASSGWKITHQHVARFPESWIEGWRPQ